MWILATISKREFHRSSRELYMTKTAKGRMAKKCDLKMEINKPGGFTKDFHKIIAQITC